MVLKLEIHVSILISIATTNSSILGHSVVSFTLNRPMFILLQVTLRLSFIFIDHGRPIKT